MADVISRRSFAALSTGLVLGSAADLAVAGHKPMTDPPKASNGPTEAPFARDYPLGQRRCRRRRCFQTGTG